ncbi:MAG TPA: cytochrome c oxidase subunit 3 family protein [Acidimicrobiales bacterium]|jgi:nitric oxide reductase NorE protein|nr:cytochrome c oxidase subunit 3 family protein [Acidimicrobiales bacterium]
MTLSTDASALSTAMPPENASVEDAQRPKDYLPGDFNMWVFVLGDMIIFAIYFIIFMVERTRDRTLFLASQQHLYQTIGLINTLVLLTSSWCMARAVRATRSGNSVQALRLVIGAAFCGIAFIAIKVVEWSLEIHHGYTLPRNDFFTFYFMLTGVHLFHVVMGLVILGVVVRELRNPDLRRVSMVEAGATYWHMVDLLWIVLFALIYVMR